MFYSETLEDEYMTKIISAPVQCLEENKTGRYNREACGGMVQESLPEEVTLELRPESAEGARNSKGWGKGEGERSGLGK